MELCQLRQFITVAETLNFRKAAERLHMAQPPLSISIRKLEEELGVRLFDRCTRAVALTVAGLATVESARACLFHADEAKRAGLQAARGLGGRLRIAFVGSATYRFLPQLVPLFRKTHPEVRLELTEATNAAVLSLLHSQEIDLGVIRTPIAQASRVELTLVERDVLVAALPPKHPLARKAQITMRDLDGEPFIHYAPGSVPGLHAIVTLVFQQAGLLPAVAQEAVQVQTVISLVESGLGVALVPGVTMHHASQRVKFRPIEDLPIGGRIGVSLASIKDRESASAMRFRQMASALFHAQAGVVRKTRKLRIPAAVGAPRGRY